MTRFLTYLVNQTCWSGSGSNPAPNSTTITTTIAIFMQSATRTRCGQNKLVGVNLLVGELAACIHLPPWNPLPPNPPTKQPQSKRGGFMASSHPTCHKKAREEAYCMPPPVVHVTKKAPSPVLKKRVGRVVTPLPIRWSFPGVVESPRCR